MNTNTQNDLGRLILRVGLGALLVAVNMMFAIALVHMGELTKLGESDGWALELQGMFLFTAIALALLGPGRYSVNGR